jgi:peptidoglycan/LPS O-acetylase OafA/YrhL
VHLTGKFIPALSQSSPLRLAILSAGSLTTAVASYYLFEKPIRHFIRKALMPIQVARRDVLNKI